MTLTNDQLEELIYDLTGSCQSIDDALKSLFELDIKDLSLNDQKWIDSWIFNCAICGWWYDIGDCEENYGEWVCGGCYETEEEKDE